jgi:hypothetical protein
MNAAAIPLTRTSEPVLPLTDRLSWSRVAAIASAVVAVMVLAFGLRAARVSTYGLSDDEINKVRAVEQYRHGQGLGVRSLSADGLPSDTRRPFVIVQPEHLTFEYRDTVTHLQRDSPPWRQFYADDALTAQVFRYPRS